MLNSNQDYYEALLMSTEEQQLSQTDRDPCHGYHIIELEE